MIKTLTNHYGVSERLQGLMCTDPVERPSKPPVPPEPQRNNFRSNDLDRSRRSRPDDVEGNALQNLRHPEEIAALAAFRGITFGNVIDQIWHFCSVDYGAQCMHIP